MLEVIAYTDGACLGNPGPGGYAAKMMAKGKVKYCSGYTASMTTNNREEMKGVLKVLDWLVRIQKEPCKLTVYTDSQLLCNCWGKPTTELTSLSRKNNDLWKEIIVKTIEGDIQLSFVKVKGHSGDLDNEEVDKLATGEAKKARCEMFGRKKR